MRYAQALILATGSQHPHVCGTGEESPREVNMFAYNRLPSNRPGVSRLYSVVPEL